MGPDLYTGPGEGNLLSV